MITQTTTLIGTKTKFSSAFFADTRGYGCNAVLPFNGRKEALAYMALVDSLAKRLRFKIKAVTNLSFMIKHHKSSDWPNIFSILAQPLVEEATSDIQPAYARLIAIERWADLADEFLSGD